MECQVQIKKAGIIRQRISLNPRHSRRGHMSYNGLSVLGTLISLAARQ